MKPLKGSRRWMRLGLAFLLAADALLLVLVWRSAALHPASELQDLERLRERHRLMEQDVARAEDIRGRLPEVEKQCDRFFAERLLPAASGYSSVVADLGKIAGELGLPASNIGYKQHEVEKRGIVEVEVTATVEGDYPSLARFINGLERSDRLYLLDSFALVSGTDKKIKLNLAMRTFFRS